MLASRLVWSADAITIVSEKVKTSRDTNLTDEQRQKLCRRTDINVLHVLWYYYAFFILLSVGIHNKLR